MCIEKAFKGAMMGLAFALAIAGVPSSARAVSLPTYASIQADAGHATATTTYLNAGSYLLNLWTGVFTNTSWYLAIANINAGTNGSTTSLVGSIYSTTPAHTPFSVSNAGTYYLSLSNSALPGSGIPTGTAYATVTSVPGPVAGAGLPILLGALGYFGYRRRRTSKEAVSG